MSDKYLAYLQREHARLQEQIEREAARINPDKVQIDRLEKLKMAVIDQIHALGPRKDDLVGSL